MSDGWIRMPLAALGFALQLADAQAQPPHTTWVDVDADVQLDGIDLGGEVSVQMFITDLARPASGQDFAQR